MKCCPVHIGEKLHKFEIKRINFQQITPKVIIIIETIVYFADG